MPSTAKTYTAHGNEPFWSVKIQEAAIIFQTPDEELSYRYAIPKEESNTIIFESVINNDSLQSKIKINILLEECFDTMSGEAFPYTATVTRDGQTYTGCAKAD